MNIKDFILVLFFTLNLFTLAWSQILDNTAEIQDYASETPKKVVDAVMIVQGYEWGPGVPKIIVEFSDAVSGFDKDTFLVKTGGSNREVLDAYSTDADGIKQTDDTNYVTFEFTVSGDASNPFAFDMKTFLNNWSDPYKLELSLAKKKSFNIGETEFNADNPFTFQMNLAGKYIIPETATWKKDSYKKGKYTLQRASFTPKGAEADGVKNPLIIWLHGAGEGGVDPDIVLLGNEVVALARDEIQKYFTSDDVKGAYVLIVQTPTMWMDRGDGQYNDKTPAGQKQESCYDDVLFSAIKDYVKGNPDIDTNRIYVGGCSNGGYMTMNLIFEHGDFFTAFYPICEAYMNKNINDEMIEQAKDYNIWFIASEDDTTVDPLITSIPTFYRFLKAGSKNVHYTLYDHVRGTDDPKTIYLGHFSWIYAFNDQVDKEFDNDKVVDDLPNVVIDKNSGAITSKDNYITNDNCYKSANMWAWMASQTKSKKLLD
jgi:predicted peptidase